MFWLLVCLISYFSICPPLKVRACGQIWFATLWVLFILVMKCCALTSYQDGPSLAGCWHHVRSLYVTLLKHCTSAGYYCSTSNYNQIIVVWLITFHQLQLFQKLQFLTHDKFPCVLSLHFIYSDTVPRSVHSVRRCFEVHGVILYDYYMKMQHLFSD